MSDTQSSNGNGKPRSHHDPLTYRLVVALLGACALVCCGGIILLGIYSRAEPTALNVIGGAAVGGLSGLLAAPPRQ